MDDFRFLKWQVYQDAKSFFKLIFEIEARLPQEYKFNLGNQLLRSTLSIVLNIAEGSGKNSDKEFSRFINIALGSLHETLAAVDILRDNNLITEKEFKMVKEKLLAIMKQLGGFKKKLKQTPVHS